MDWKPISSLQLGKLAFLRFDERANEQWVGYINRDGICEWPARVEGLRPSGWQEILVDLTRLKAVGG